MPERRARRDVVEAEQVELHAQAADGRASSPLRGATGTGRAPPGSPRPCRRCAGASARFWSPRQYAPETASSLNGPILPVDATCGPRHRSRNGAVLVDRGRRHRRARRVRPSRAGRRGSPPCSAGRRSAKNARASSAAARVATNAWSAATLCGHARLDRREVVGRQRPRQVEVVVEAVRDRRPDAELGAREQVQHGLGHHVRRRVAHRVERVAARRRPGAPRRSPSRAPRSRAPRRLSSGACCRPSSSPSRLLRITKPLILDRTRGVPPAVPPAFATGRRSARSWSR